MERLFFLAAHLTLFMTLVAWALDRPKIEFQSDISRSIVLLISFVLAVFALGIVIDNYYPVETNSPAFLPVAAAAACLYGVGAAGVFFAMGFHYKENLARPGYGALALATCQFLLVVAHPAGIPREILNFFSALTFAFAVAVLTVHQTRRFTGSPDH